MSGKDKCVFIKFDDTKVFYCGTTVDDCFFVCMNDEEWIKEQIKLIKNKFEDITIESGEKIGLVGMQIFMDCENKQVFITQPKHVEQIIETLDVTKGAPNPVLKSLLGDNVGSPLLADQTEYMSRCAMLMYLSQCTYPEICPIAIKLSTKNNKATKEDIKKAMRVAEYVFGCKEAHKLVLKPKSMKLISAADASYVKHPDGKSHSGGMVGFESETSYNFGFVSTKQPVVAKSAGEADLIAHNKVGDLVEWVEN